LPLKVVFLPLMNSWFNYLSNLTELSSKYEVGDRIKVNFNEGDEIPDRIIFKDNDAEISRAEAEKIKMDKSVDFGIVEKPGVFLIEKYIRDKIYRQPIVVNVSPVEGNLKTTEVKKIKELLPGEVKIISFNNPSDFEKRLMQARSGLDLSRFFVFPLFLLFIFESLMGNYLIRGKGKE